MKSQLRTIDDHGKIYTALMFKCPGCQITETVEDGSEYTRSGIHLLPVNSPHVSPSWDFDGNLDAPTLSPSILSSNGPYSDTGKPMGVCHSFLRAGVFEFLPDSTHPLAGQHVPMPDL